MNIIKKFAAAGASSVLAFTGCFSHLYIISDLGNADAAGLTAVQLVEDMGQGWNLGNTFDCTNTWTTPLTPNAIETAWGNPTTTEAMIQEIKKSGFKTVRIPITWYQMMSSDGTPNSEFLARIKEVVDYCINNGMYAIINTHHDESDWLKSSDDNTTAKFKKLWTNIANYFKSYDQHLVFEAMNEQNIDNSGMMKLNQAFVDAVRATGGNNKDRLLLVEAQSNNTSKLLDSSFSAPSDSSKMIAVSCHYYEPPQFCVADLTSDWGHYETWGTSSDISTLRNDFDKLERKFVNNGIPVIIGEYGVNTSNKGGKNKDSIKKFLKEVAEYALSKNGICPVVWDMSVDNNGEGDMAYFNRRTLRWYDSSIGDLFKSVSGTSSQGGDEEKTTKVTFKASDIAAVDAESGKTYWQVDLSPYRQSGAKLKTAYVEFKWNKSGNVQNASGDIAVSFNMKDESGNLHYSNIDSSIGLGDNAMIIDLAPAKFNIEWNADNQVTKTAVGAIDMDYLKFENWWTWSDAGETSVTLESVELTFEGEVKDEPIVTTTTTSTSTTTTTTTTTTTVVVTDPITTTTYDGMSDTLKHADISVETISSPTKTFFVGQNCEADAFKGYSAHVKIDAEYTSGRTGVYETDLTGAETIPYLSYPTGEYSEYPPLLCKSKYDFSEVDSTKPGRYPVYLDITFTSASAGKYHGVAFYVQYVNSTNNDVEEVSVWGDANLSGEVKMNDAVLVMQALANADLYGIDGTDKNHITRNGELSADVYENGISGLTNMDAVQIQKFLIHAVTSLDPRD